jgi:phosphoribosylformylglycinamidine cyclo-ligase
MSEKITYQKAGVDPDKAGTILSNFAAFLKSRPKSQDVLSGIGPFASCFSLKRILADYADPVMVSSCDGVGTKAKLALEWNAIDKLGEDLVAMNVNDLLCAGATPAIFLDYYACGRLDDHQLTTILKSIQQGCELADCALVGGETAEMPGVYAGEEFDLAGFTVGFADKSNLLGPQRVKAGDVIVAVASSGFHSNGYSLIRKLVEREKLKPEDRPSFSKETWREILLKPTRIYVKAVRDQLKSVHALAHITGGGLFENLPRVLPGKTQAVIDAAKWEIPPLFLWAQEKAGLSTKELLGVLNCGAGMLAIAPPDSAAGLIRSLESHGEKAKIVGRMEASSSETPSVIWQ